MVAGGRPWWTSTPKTLLMAVREPQGARLRGMEQFFRNLARWRKWCSDMTDTTAVERAKNHPGMAFDSNIFRAPDGSVWGRSWDSPNQAYVRLTREGANPWAKTDDVQKLDKDTLVPSYDEPDADWPWYRSPDGHTELRSREASLQSARRGVAFAGALLAQRKAIVAWAKVFVVGQDRRDARSTDGDFPALVTRFFPFAQDAYSLNVPDHGSVLCSLHSCLDTLAGCENVRSYWF